MPTDKQPIYPTNKMITVIISNPGPFAFMQEPLTHRTVHLELTPEQKEKLKLNHVGISSGQDIYEEISSVFIEDNHAPSINYEIDNTIRDMVYLQSLIHQDEKFLKEMSEEQVIDRMSLQGHIESCSEEINELQKKLDKLENDRFNSHLDDASEKVKTWPEWKQNLLSVPQEEQ